jgi:putative membrane-bound dehydrogenase-like protein
MRAVVLLHRIVLASVSLTLIAAHDTSATSLHVPAVFTVELVAGPPLVERPITAAFDDAGRLYVADSSGSNDPVEQQLKTRPHCIIRLEDVDGDGRYDRSTVFADRMMFPEGTMYYDGSLYVAAPPSIWKLTDTNDDGIADVREEWFQGKTLTGCANDLHGPYLGPDGWIYWCKGAFAQQTHRVNGRDWKTRAAHIFRCRPDGSGLDVVMTGGMDNPVDVTFTRSGERIFSATFLVHPGNGQRDGLAHAVYGGVFGKVHGVLEGHPRTGPLLPVLTHMGPAAPCGLARYDSDEFGDEYVDNLFACQFNLHKVSRHVLVPTGSSFVTQDSDFVTSDSVDFHPTDVLMDADGSLLIIDTGGWYKLCCPTSQLEKPDILGGIYRVRKKSPVPPRDPRGRQLVWGKLDVSQLWELLSDKRPAVRQRATSALRAQRSTGAMREFLAQGGRGHAVDLGNDRSAALARIWALGQIDTIDAQGLILEGLDHSDEQVRHAALNLVSLHRDAASEPKLLAILASDTPANRRVAAEALGRIGNRSAVAPLLAASAAADDRMLQHAIIFALIELGDPDATRVGLTSSDYRTQAAALIALDQMSDGRLDPSKVVSRLDSPDAGLRESVQWVLFRHPQWGEYLADWFSQQLADLSDGARSSADATLEDLLVAFSSNPTVEETMATQLRLQDSSETARRLVLSAMARSKLTAAPTTWLKALAELINDPNPRLLSDAVAAIQALPPPNQANIDLNKTLARVTDDSRLPMELRVQALAIISGSLPNLNKSQFALLVNCCSEESPLVSRSAAADAISTARLSTEQLEVLCDLVKAARPLEINQLISPFVNSTDDELGIHLLTSLKEAKSLPALRIDALRETLKKYGPKVQQGINELHALLNVDLEGQRQRIADLLPQISRGDVRRGQSVFYSSKAACSACHRMGYAGGLTGPDLTLIGKTRTRRDLLESIVFPSLSFVRSFEPVVVVTSDGRVLNGLIRDKTTTEVVLATGPNQEVRLSLNDVDEIQPSNISIMPAGLDKQLSLQEIADVIAFLEHATGQ